jgi:hypothetical protein
LAPVPADTVTWYFEWRSQGVGEERVKFDASGLAESLSRSRTLWAV